mgnify:CR=1 FL=1
MKLSPRSPFLTYSLHLQKRPYKIRLRDHHPADQKPLPDIHQMRETNVPHGIPASQSIDVKKAQTEPFPFVPATWIT